MIQKLLIANRGEIAVRIIRACKEMGIVSVAIYSEGDKEALHVQLADEAYCVGPTLSKDSYLNVTNIITIAKMTGCDAIHPGYGFLSENAAFAEVCGLVNIQFVGPSPEAIQKMGIKDEAKRTMIEAGVPTVPGSDGIVTSVEQAKEIAAQIGYPVIIKATAGGGGRGIRIVRDEAALEEGIAITQQEAKNAFGNSGVYLEKFIENFGHVEVQILADHYGNIVHLGERDCTIQRRMQKLVEESPSPALDEQIRMQMGADAVKAAKAVGYFGAGTIEFIYDYKERCYYFMEMNTRIQVEHPVTEMVTGIDLIKEMIRIASGEPLRYKQKDICLNGWSIECRINAENPYKNFMPSPGTVTSYFPPGGFGIRIDAAVYPGCTISPSYDSMIGKIIVHGESREEAIMRMRRALDELIIEGVHTTIPFHLKLFEHVDFIRGSYDTKFLEEVDIMRT